MVHVGNEQPRSIGLGIIGGGGAFGRFIASALPCVPGVTLTAIAGSDEARTRRAAEQLGVSYWTINYRELAEHSAVDLVIVASPPHLHAEMGLAVLRAGKALFLEKPVATTVADGLALLAEAKRSSAPVAVDYVMRYSPVYKTAQQIIHSGALGALRRMDFRNDAGDEGLAADHWFWDREKSGGIFIEHGVHFFDVYGWLAGANPQSVHGLAQLREASNVQDVVHADVRYGNGVLGTFTHAFDKPSRLESQDGLLTFDHGTVRIAGWTPVRLDMAGLVDAEQRAALAAIADLKMTIAEHYDPPRPMRGRGQPFAVDAFVRGAFAPSVDSQELYRLAVGDALADLVTSMRDPAHRQSVTLEDGVRSLAVACVAAGTADEAQLAQVLALL